MSIYTRITGILLIVYVAVQVYCIQQLSINYDETLFFDYGVTILKGQGNKDIERFDSKLPITALNVLPRAVEQLFHPGLTKMTTAAHADIMHGRYISLIATVLLSLLIYHWSGLLYGPRAGLGSFIIFLLCPNFLAHGIFVSSDIYACLFMTAALFFLWRFGKTILTKDFLYASLFVGLAEISKFSMVHLLLLFPVLLFMCFFTCRNRHTTNVFTTNKLISLFFLFAFINWLIIGTAHLFYGMFIPLNNYQFRSAPFQHLQLVLHTVGDYIPVPLPSAYIKSMDAVIYFDGLGGGMPGSLNGPSYILGKSSTHGFWYYYFVTLFYKLPVTVLLLALLTLFLYARKTTLAVFIRNEVFLVLPLLYFLIYLSFFYSTQLGIRHIMIILPLLYIFTGFFFQQTMNIIGGYMSRGLILYQLISVALYFPNFLPYTNEFIQDKKMAYKKIADTNLCYGEAGKYLAQYLQLHQEATYLPAGVTAGKVIMEVNEMVNLDIRTMGKFDWTRGLVPVDHIHSEYLVFDVSSSVADSLKKVH